MENQKLIVNEDLIEGIEDTKGKLEDCLESIKIGRGIDSTQEAFLRSLGLVE